MEEIRSNLDSWFGPNRNGDKPEAVIRDFRDAKVCKNYLLGLCPNSLFTNTRDDLAPCHAVHDDRLKKAYEELAQTYDFGYERALERTLEGILNEAERKISKGKERVAEEDPSVSAFIVTVNLENAPELIDIHNSIDDKIIEMEGAQDRGDLDTVAKLSEEIEALRRQKYELQAKLLLATATEEDRKPSAVTNKQKLRVCDICGALLSLNDSEERIADHFGGKSHLGYHAIRNKLNFIREWRKTVRASAAGGATAHAPGSIDRPVDRFGGRDGRDGGERRRSRSRERRDDYRRDDARRDDRRDDYRRDYREREPVRRDYDRRDYRDDRRDYRDSRDDRRDAPRDDRREAPRDDRRDYRRY